MSAVVVIPVYKTKMDESELISFKQGCKILCNHPIVIVCPHNLDLSEYKTIYSNIIVEHFEKHYFANILGYNNLLMSDKFYKRFISFEYMLIYQLDAYVFNDELNYWCQKGYDFIGAPWLEGYTQGSKLQPFAGNGGFSLRNIKNSIRVLTEFKYYMKPKELFSYYYNNYSFIHFISKLPIIFLKLFGFNNSFKHYFTNIFDSNEDMFFVHKVPQYFNWFKVAKSNEAVAFSIEFSPREMFKINNNKLPFGCHAWLKYDYDFWKPYILESANV